jgi:hypothetical protein
MNITVSGIEGDFIIGDAVLIEIFQKLEIVKNRLFPVMVAMDQFVVVVFILITQFVKVELQNFGFLKINYRECQHIVRLAIHRIKQNGPYILIVHMILKLLVLGKNLSRKANEKQDKKGSHIVYR